MFAIDSPPVVSLKSMCSWGSFLKNCIERVPLFRRSIIKDFISTVRSGSCRFLRAQSTWRLERKNVNNGVVSPYPFRSVVYSGLAAAECTFWELAWLAKNCARVKCRLKVRAGLSYQSTLFGIIKAGHRCNYLRFFVCANRCNDGANKMSFVLAPLVNTSWNLYVNSPFISLFDIGRQ